MSSGPHLDTDQILVDVDGGIGRLTFNNPRRRNAVTYGMLLALSTSLQWLQDQRDVRVVIVRGAGEKSFVSGADITEFAERRTDPEARAEYDRAAAGAARAWSDLEKPIIAMIRGSCMGGGLVTALRADIRICDETAYFGIPAARLGLGYGIEGVLRLVEIVGPAWASELLFSARRLKAPEAVPIGLVNRLVPSATLESEVAELADSIVMNAPLTVRECKVAIREALKPASERDLVRVNALIEGCFRSSDYREGQQAFLERRQPQFNGW